MLKPIIGLYSMPNFHGENFCGWLQSVKFVNVFSLESFVLYGIGKNFYSKIVLMIKYCIGKNFSTEYICNAKIADSWAW